jgi:hypothetical protein
MAPVTWQTLLRLGLLWVKKQSRPVQPTQVAAGCPCECFCWGEFVSAIGGCASVAAAAAGQGCL